MSQFLALRQAISLSSSLPGSDPRISNPTVLLHCSRSRKLPKMEAGKSAVCCQATVETTSQKLDEEVKAYHAPVLSMTEVISRLKTMALNSTHYQVYRAMYSSVIGGITTNPAMMLIPLDDHMVHRGHGVFDTALIVNGFLYELDTHLDRLLKSASMASITPPFNRSTLREILVATAAASDCRDGSLRYWLSAGPGDFNLSSKQCTRASFYVIVLKYDRDSHDEGVTVVTSSIPMKPPQFATMKNVNYLPNALSLLEAEEKGAFAGIWVDDEGFVAEGPNMNVAFVNHEGELLMPAFDNILSGCTAKRTLTLAHELLKSNTEQQVVHLKGVTVRPISVEEAKNASEMMMIGSGLPIVPVIEWDQQKIGDGRPGPITFALQDLLKKDMLDGPRTQREPIPYGDRHPDVSV